MHLRGAQSAATIIETLPRQNALDLGQATLGAAQSASACLQQRAYVFRPRGKLAPIRRGQGCGGGHFCQPGFDGFQRLQVTGQQRPVQIIPSAFLATRKPE